MQFRVVSFLWIHPPSRYGARNAVSAASISSGAVSATQWPVPGMTTVCTSFAATCPTASPQLAAPPIARTGIVSGRVVRCSFCARVASHARYNPKLPRRASGLERSRT